MATGFAGLLQMLDNMEFERQRIREEGEREARNHQSVIDSIYAQRGREDTSPLVEVPPVHRRSFEQQPAMYSQTPPIEYSGPSSDTVVLTSTLPPLPYVVPFNPAQDLKRKTAIGFRMTPEATEDLYNTPATVDYSFINRSPETLGQYRSTTSLLGGRRDGELFVYGGPDNFSPEAIMQHEYTHKRYYEGGPFRRYDWEWTGQPQMVPRGTIRYESNIGPVGEWASPAEAYAYNSEAPWEMTQEQRDRYYPGMWRENAWEEGYIHPLRPRPKFVPLRNYPGDRG